jgi:hypothetical protein
MKLKIVVYTGNKELRFSSYILSERVNSGLEFGNPGNIGIHGFLDCG